MLEVLRFKCQRISLGLVFQFEGLVSKVSSDPFFFCCCCFVGLKFVRWFLQVLYVCQSFGCQYIASGSLVWCVRGFRI